MLLKILAGILILIAAFFGVAALQPAEFSISRSVMVDAPPATVFAQINDFHKWEHWSPWAKLDPEMKTSYSGPVAGPGTSYAWEGNGQVGAGKMTIASSEAPSVVRIDLEFLKPMQAKNLTEFRIEPQGTGSQVTWSMSGERNLVSKAMGLVMSMEQMIGPDFERGLLALKSVSESAKTSPE
jgi:hypothetical protein